MRITDRVHVIDIDGETLAIFPGYAWKDGLSVDLMRETYPTFQKCILYNSKGEMKGLVV